MIGKQLYYSVLAAGLAAALATCVCPLALIGHNHQAYAAQEKLTTASAASAQSMTLSAPANAKTSVYVIAKADNWKYSYNKYGLLTKTESPASIPSKITYAYDKKMRLSKFKAISNNVRQSSGSFAYDKQGRLAKLVSNGSHGSNNYKVKLKYDKRGRPATEVWCWLSYNGATMTSKNSFDEKGRLIKKVHEASGNASLYSYDTEGNLTRAGTQTWVNTYRNGRLSLKSRTDLSTAVSTAYSYKKISIPKKYASQVRKQQWALLNRDASFVFPPYF